MATLIKRYANRKLYNTETSRYITLKGIGDLLERGEEVQVVDNESGEDITQITLSQILVDSERARSDPSDTLLTQILSRGGDAVYTAIRKSVDDATDGIGEFQQRFRDLVAKGETLAQRSRPFAWERREREGEQRAAPAPGATPFRSGAGRDTARETSAAGSGLPSRTEIERLNRNLERVAAALERLETTLEKSRFRAE